MEQRRFNRAPIDVTVLFAKKDEDDFIEGNGRDICLGGMFIETASAAPFGARVVIHATLPGQNAEFALPGVVRWTGPRGMGVQFGLLGARETFAITEIVRKFEESRR